MKSTVHWTEIEKCPECRVPFPLLMDDEKREYAEKYGRHKHQTYLGTAGREIRIGVCAYCKSPLTAGARAADTRAQRAFDALDPTAQVIRL